MKKTFLVLSFCLIVSSLFAQDMWKTKDSAKKKVNVKHQLSSGKYLQQAGSLYLAGAGLSIVGSVVALTDKGGLDDTKLYAGGVIALGGVVFTLIAHSKLISAGRALEKERKITFQPSSSGIGLALKF